MHDDGRVAAGEGTYHHVAMLNRRADQLAGVVADLGEPIRVVVADCDCRLAGGRRVGCGHLLEATGPGSQPA